MKRSPIRARPRPETDRVTAELYAYLMGRDRGCVLHKLDPTHLCKDRWGYSRSPYDPTALTVEHVHDALMMGKRAPSDRSHTLILCAGANIGVPSKAQREMLRAYLQRVEGGEA